MPFARGIRPRVLRILGNDGFRRRMLVFACLCVPFILEALWHVRAFRLHSPPLSVDAPFQRQCVPPDVDAPRENATFLMLARNEDLEGAKSAVESLEQRFNQHFNYPIVFLNDKPWDEGFIRELSGLASGETTFETIPAEQWEYPTFIDQEKARSSITSQGESGILYAGKESYHHMCRFYSGMFYDHPSLSQYKYYWRLEPDTKYTCAIPYDPFRRMREQGKKYGYTIALWERGETSPSLFRKVADYKVQRGIKTNALWMATIEPSWMPWPVRKLLPWLLNHRDAGGDVWSFCHFWSNFEIADLDFYRSQEYRDFFAYLDRAGGFYYERWGDAPVHSLAAALFLEPQELHRFEDVGYTHDPFWTCPANARNGQMPESPIFGDQEWTQERDEGVGCRCQCSPQPSADNFDEYCLRRFDSVLRSSR